MNSKPHLPYVMAFGALCLSVASADAANQWQAIFEGAGVGDDIGFEVRLDPNENVYVAGSETGLDQTEDFLLLKYDLDGQFQWSASYAGSAGGDDVITALAVSGLQYIYVTGWSVESDSTTSITTIKYAADGGEEWIRSYDAVPESREDLAYDIEVDSQGNVYVVGYSWIGDDEVAATLLKYDAGGNLLWDELRSAGPGQRVEGYGVALGPGEDPVICADQGTYGDLSGESFDLLVLRYTAGGTEDWSDVFDQASGVDRSIGIQTGPAGSVFVTGCSGLPGEDLDFVTLKYDSAGTRLWSRLLDASPGQDDAPTSLVVSEDLPVTVVVTGDSWEGEDLRDIATVAYDTDGNELWSNVFDMASAAGESDDIAAAVRFDTDGGAVVAGHSYDLGQNIESATVKFDAAGEVEWIQRFQFGDSISILVQDLAIAGDGLKVVVGSALSDSLDNAVGVVAYTDSSIVADAPSFPESTGARVLWSVGPNPHKASFETRVVLGRATEVELSLFDVEGRRVAVIHQGSLTAGDHRIPFAAERLVAGTYYLRLVTPDVRKTRKVVRVR